MKTWRMYENVWAKIIINNNNYNNISNANENDDEGSRRQQAVAKQNAEQHRTFYPFTNLLVCSTSEHLLKPFAIIALRSLQLIPHSFHFHKTKMK